MIQNKVSGGSSMRSSSNYKYLIFDVDDTLLDFNSAYTKAQEVIAKRLGIENSDEYKQLDDKCVWRAWRECGSENTETKDVQDNYHIYYFQYIKKHFFYLVQELQMEIDANELVRCYIESISSSKDLMECDTLHVYMELAKSYRLVLATNGIESIQNPRISEFIPFTYKTYISESIGHIKPSKLFFDSVIQDLGCEIKDCLMIGDSMTNDIIGAKEIGMDVCYYNFKQKTSTNRFAVDYEVNRIAELLKILL